jgi:hypothetical protein
VPCASKALQLGVTHRHDLLVLHALDEQPLPLLVLPLLHLQVQRLLVPAAAQQRNRSKRQSTPGGKQCRTKPVPLMGACVQALV